MGLPTSHVLRMLTSPIADVLTQRLSYNQLLAPWVKVPAAMSGNNQSLVSGAHMVGGES